MIIKKIILNNFRQYEGKQAVEFSTDLENNVTVILGQNTSGKTTLIQAFSWCLYEKTNFKRRSEILNSDVLRALPINGSEVAYVEVELVHSDQLYTIRRSQRFEKKSVNGNPKVETSRFDVSFKQPDGQTQIVPHSDREDTINKILPEQLSDYFFFAGEHIDKIDKTKNVKEAVRALMGLEVIAKSKDHFDPNSQSSVISKLENSLDLKATEDGSRMLIELDETKKNLAVLNERKEYLESESGKLREDIEVKNRLILANQGAKHKQEERATLEREIQRLESQLVDAEKTHLNNFMRGHFKFFAKPLYEKALKVIADTRAEGEGIPEMHAPSIDYIIERGRCICGNDLDRNQRAIDSLNEERRLLPPAYLGTTIRKYREKCEDFNNDSDDYADTITDSYKAIRNIIRALDEKKERLKDISKDISSGDINVRKIEEERREINESLSRNLNQLSKLSEKIGELKRDIENLNGKISGLAAGNEKNQKISLAIAYANSIYEHFKSSYDVAVEEVKSGLNNSIEKLFAEMFHGKRRVVINDDYTITLKVDSGGGEYELDTSMGLDAVKNFAFVTGLVELARQKAQKREEIGGEMLDASTEPYPIVMDAPFSNTDDEHISNISRVISRIAEQVIFIIMKKDWAIAEKEIGIKVGKIYEIKKNSETNSTIVQGGVS